MCRHLAYLGTGRTLRELLYAPEHSLETQAYRPRMSRSCVLNADGFGAGWYDASRLAPVRYRRAQPMWTDLSFADVADVVRTRCAVAAVRSATVGFPVDESCAQPFTDGTRLFSHNGAVKEFAEVEGKLRELAGDLAPLPDARAPVDSALVFALAVVFVFLVLAAQYESLTLPLSIILIVPMCLFAAMVGVNLRGMDNNVLTQIGLVVLIALAAKNAILIVEFARQAEEQDGLSPVEAAVRAARDRLRPILMTSFAFILGAVPLLIASGAGAELRQALGTAVFFGMIGVTAFGLLFTPTFYVVCRALGDRIAALRRRGGSHEPVPQPAE